MSMRWRLERHGGAMEARVGDGMVGVEGGVALVVLRRFRG